MKKSQFTVTRIEKDNFGNNVVVLHPDITEGGVIELRVNQSSNNNTPDIGMKFSVVIEPIREADLKVNLNEMIAEKTAESAEVETQATKDSDESTILPPPLEPF